MELLIPYTVLFLIISFHDSFATTLVDINLPWGYALLNRTGPIPINELQCQDRYEPLELELAENITYFRLRSIADTFHETTLKFLVKETYVENITFLSYCSGRSMLYTGNHKSCDRKHAIYKSGDPPRDANEDFSWVPFKIKTPKLLHLTYEHYCLVYDVSSGQATTMGCTGQALPGIICQESKRDKSASDMNPKQMYERMRDIFIIGSSICLATMIILITTAVCWCCCACRNRNCCGRSQSVDVVDRSPLKLSQAARGVRLQSLTSDNSSAAYDHIPRDPLSRSMHSLNALGGGGGDHQQQQNKLGYGGGNFYNEPLGSGGSRSEARTNNPYSQPYTHFVPPHLQHQRNSPPKVAPPLIPEDGGEYAEPYLLG